MHVHANPQVNACTTHSMHAPHTACMCMHMPNAIFRGRGGCPVQGTWVGGNHHACACACMHACMMSWGDGWAMYACMHVHACVHACIHVHVRMHACSCNICMHACACMQHVHACMTATDSNNSSSASTRNPEASRKKPLSVSMAQKETPKRQERNP